MKPNAPLHSKNARGMLYGIHPVEAILLKNPSSIQVFFALSSDEKSSDSHARDRVVQQAKDRGIVPSFQTRAALDQLSQGGNHQGLVILCEQDHVYTEWPTFLEQVRTATRPPLVLILDGVTDPQNVGALIRSTFVLGGLGLVIPQDRAAPVTAAVVKASSGTTQFLPIARVPNLVRAMEQLKEAGLWLYGTTLDNHATQLPWKTDLTGPVGFVLGSEGHGLRPLVQKTCDVHIQIPMPESMQGASLNVSACGSVLLYEALRQRSQRG